MAIPGYEAKQTSTGPDQTTTQITDWLSKGTRTLSDPQELKVLLETKHAEYSENIGYWKRCGDVALDRVKTDKDKRAYLVQGVNEGDEAFTKRTALSAFSAETPELLNDFIGAVFGVSATRELTEGAGAAYKAKIEAFLPAAGPDQSPLNEISKQALRYALTFNRVDGILDHPSDMETEVPYLTLQTPENRYDWQIDADGNYVWVKYHERRIVKGDWGVKPVTIDEYRIYTAPFSATDGAPATGKIVTYQVVNQEGEEEKILGPDVVDHRFPVCPCVPLWWDKIGNAWVKPLVERDTKTFRIESDHTFDMFNTAHPTLLAWMHGDDKVTFEKLRRGSEKAIHLNPGNPDQGQENAAYLVTDVGALQHQSDQAKEGREATRRLAGTSGQMEQSAGTDVQSGVALAYQQAQRSKNYQTAAQSLAEWEWRILELVLLEGSAENDLERDDIINLRYPSSFDLRDENELAQDLAAARETGSETLAVEVKKALASKILGSNATPELMDKINKEIEAAKGEDDALREAERGGEELPVRKQAGMAGERDGA